MRKISLQEYRFLKTILEKKELSCESFGISESLFVEDLDDGGMGSLIFCHTQSKDENRVLGNVIIEGDFTDSDNVLVNFTVNVDQNGKLFELDLWKVDFSPLLDFPKENCKLNIK